MKRHIPNFLTCCNLLSGALAVGAAYYQNFDGALLFIVIGAVFDFFDGLVARYLGVSGPIGKELDSLADVVTFGLAPAVIALQMIYLLVPTSAGTYSQLLCVVALPIAAFSALRLAKFNLDTRQSQGFIGLPTPANALFWGALADFLYTKGHLHATGPIALPLLATVVMLVPVSCWLMVSEVPMFALKFQDFTWASNRLRYCFIAFAAALILTSSLMGWGQLGVALTIMTYVALSIAVGGKVALPDPDAEF